MRLMSGRFLLCLFDLPAILLLAADTVIFRTALYLLYTLQNSLYSVFLNFSAAFFGTCLIPWSGLHCGHGHGQSQRQSHAAPCLTLVVSMQLCCCYLMAHSGCDALRYLEGGPLRPSLKLLSLLSLCCLFRMAAAGAAALTVISGSGLRCRCLLLSW